MRARLAAIVLSTLVGMGVLAFLAGTASASTPMPAAGSPDHVAAPQPAHGASASAAWVQADDDNSGESIHGTLRANIGKDGAREPIPGVTIVVSLGGKEVGKATSGDDGTWKISLPKAGTYEITLDTGSLPDTVQLKKADGNTLSGLRVQPGSSKVALFQLKPAGGATTSGESGQLEYYLSVLVAGLRYGLIIAMTAVGLSLIFGTTGLINFAHGELVTIGAVVAYIFGTSPLSWPFIVAIVIAIIAVAALGGLLELSLWRPLRKRGTGLIQMFIISIGLSLLLRHIILFFFGSQREHYEQATIQQPLHLGPVDVSPRDLTIIIVSIVILLAVALMLQKTRMGKAMRALADNKDLAEASGIDVKRVILQVWMLGGGLAAIGGVFFGLTTSVYWNMGWYLLLLMFAGVILGGLGSAYGAMLGSLVVGIVAQGSTIWFSADLQNAWALLVLILVLLVRPQGILGRLQRAG